MSSSEAQKSPVHQATEDSSAEPTGPTGLASVTPGSGARAADGNAADPRSDINLHEAADLKARPDNALGVPGNFERGAAMAGRRPDTDDDTSPLGAGPVIGGGPGAGDASSGGGAGAGIAGGGTDMRTNGAFNTGDPENDRQRLFPDASGNRQPGAEADKSNPNDPDESSFGGPLNLDDPDAV